MTTKLNGTNTMVNGMVNGIFSEVTNGIFSDNKRYENSDIADRYIAKLREPKAGLDGKFIVTKPMLDLWFISHYKANDLDFRTLTGYYKNIKAFMKFNGGIISGEEIEHFRAARLIGTKAILDAGLKQIKEPTANRDAAGQYNFLAFCIINKDNFDIVDIDTHTYNMSTENRKKLNHLVAVENAKVNSPEVKKVILKAKTEQKASNTKTEKKATKPAVKKSVAKPAAKPATKAEPASKKLINGMDKNTYMKSLLKNY